MSPLANRLPGPDASDLAGADLTDRQFQRICGLLYGVARINLGEGKQPLVRSRLSKRVRQLGLADFEEYLALVESPGGAAELAGMVDALTTNKTSFFREAQHFDFLVRDLAEHFRSRSRLRIWSAGCSTGQEPYTLGIVLREALTPEQLRDTLVLATDIAAPVLERARRGEYSLEELEGISPAQRERWFAREARAGGDLYRVRESVSRMIRFARLNLMDAWPMQGPFDYIFCRNVMIYFDRETQQQLVARFRTMLRDGGCLLVGHAESLSGRADGLNYVVPAVYRR